MNEEEMIKGSAEEMMFEIDLEIMQVMLKATGMPMTPKQIADFRAKREKERQMKKDFKLT